MSEPSLLNDRLLELAGNVCSKTASDAELAELNALLRQSDEDAYRRYLRYCQIHVRCD